MDSALEAYLRKQRGLPVEVTEEDAYGADPADMDRSLSPEPLALRQRPRFGSLLEGEAPAINELRLQAEAETDGGRRVDDVLAEVAGRGLGRQEAAAGGMAMRPDPRSPLPAAPRLASLPSTDEGGGAPVGYLAALRRAQQQDDRNAAFARLGQAGEQFAEVASRGAYKASPLPPMPSEVSKEEKRRAAVAEYLRQRRDEETAAADNALKRAHADFYGKPKPPPPARPRLTQKQLDERHTAELALKAAQTAAAGRANRPQPTKPPAPAKDRGLPASEVKDLADFDTATEQLDDLLKNFDSLNMGGIGGKLGGKATDWLGLQGTDSAAYLADARRAMQAVGTILEGGKLAAGDEVKYRRMLPEPGDPPELARRKVDGLKQLLANLRAKREQRFKASGFSDAAQPASKVAVSNGSETLYIDPQDVPAAEADGYKVVKP